jgi:hypothetical protein
MPDTVSLYINGRKINVASGLSVAAAIALLGSPVTRISVSGTPRAPLCGMGICQECRVTIDGQPHQLACQSVCETGMHILTGESA